MAHLIFISGINSCSSGLNHINVGCHLKNIINNTAYIIKSAKCLINNPYCKFSHLYISENINLILWGITAEFIETREWTFCYYYPGGFNTLDHKNTSNATSSRQHHFCLLLDFFIPCNHFMCSLKSMSLY